MNILLCCNAGMSSSILVKKIREAAQKRGMDLTITAVPSAAIRDEVGKWDVCLVGPQLSYAVSNIKTQLNIPVASVEPRVYAMADGDKALDFALGLMEGQDIQMVNIEKISETAMTVITYSGMAKSCYMEALALAKQGKFAESDEKMNEGSTHFLEAHHGHADVLAEEMSKEEPQISLLMTHAEDQLMGAETLKIVILELIEIYKEKRG